MRSRIISMVCILCVVWILPGMVYSFGFPIFIDSRMHTDCLKKIIQISRVDIIFGCGRGGRFVWLLVNHTQRTDEHKRAANVKTKGLVHKKTAPVSGRHPQEIDRAGQTRNWSTSAGHCIKVPAFGIHACTNMSAWVWFSSLLQGNPTKAPHARAHFFLLSHSREHCK